MSGGTTAAWVAAAAAVAGTAVSVYNGQQQAKAQESAQQQAMANAKKQDEQADQAFNASHQKKPDTAGILAAAQQAGKAGPSGTMLTGAQGIDPSALQLGKTTLLGQ